MADFRLTPRAAAQLVDIYDFTEARFGLYQAQAYDAGFEHSFKLLSDFPCIGLSADDLRKDLRLFRGKFLALLAEAHADGRLKFFNAHAGLAAGSGPATNVNAPSAARSYHITRSVGFADCRIAVGSPSRPRAHRPAS